ncbi:ABC transporter ATP-binding protein [Umezawaea sp. Da 62-37]|uniref:ABC transporter ATP-binding protein n=1 Tax=Umezawaea sp. Da 62-37 TaxID=3075927 RepID=UPI0028F71EE8|nr:ABC transporter ATP-binding protein [Umezawaea sp. Da 62-37]WNV90773.1 ABC transporter ATP-binding protein [Umezawaea sp. Da 62-37]
MRLPVADAAGTRRAIGRLIRADGRAVALVVLLNCLAAAAGLGAPWLLGRIVNEVHDGTPVSTVDELALGIVGFGVAQLLLIRFARYAGHRFGERALSSLREQVVDRALALPTAVVERAGTGDLMTRSSSDVATIGTTLRDGVPEVFISVVQVVFLFGAVFLLHPLLGLCGLVASPVLWLSTRWYLRRARDAYLAEARANSEQAEHLAATAQGARTVEALGLQRRRIASGDERIAIGMAAKCRTLVLRNVWFPILDFAHALPVAAMLLAGGWLHTRDVVSLGAVISATLYMWQLHDPFDRVFQWADQLQTGGAALARIEGVGAAVVQGPVRTDVPVDDRLVVSGVHYAYREGHDVLVDVDLVVRPGERLAIVGPSGAGKSTLGRLLAGVDAPRLGRVAVGGVPVAELPPAELRRRVVLVTQEHHVFLGTLRDNLLMAAPHADDNAMRAALSTVDADWADDLDREVDDRALDPAQAQQLALARVVLADPRTVVLDEATALLDPTTARHAERAMAAVLEGRTVIAIAHRLRTAHDADRVAVIDDGRIIELGSHDELVAAQGVYAALWKSWQGG